MRRPPNMFGLVVFGALCLWGAWQTRIYLYPDSAFLYAPILLALLGALCAFRAVLLLITLIPTLIMRNWRLRLRQRAGSAGWASRRETKKHNMHKRRGFLAGLVHDRALFVDVESAGLVLSPAGGGKTVNFVIPALCFNPSSMIVPDWKGTLTAMTADVRREKYGHEVYTLNPSGAYADQTGPSARYNPLIILIDDWDTPEAHKRLLGDAAAIARQLYPDPQRVSENQFFRNASRKMIVFAIVYVVIMGGQPTLSAAYTLLADFERMSVALHMASRGNHLAGGLSLLAKDLLRKFAEGDPKQIESFREGAVQALESFAPSGELADITSSCDTRFYLARKKKATFYIVPDPTRPDEFAQFIGLLMWCAMTELTRHHEGEPVYLLCDEATNFRIDGLPDQLTRAREYGIRMWLVVQELEQWAAVYGREALETLLSQTQVKIIFGTQSQNTAELVSRMLGNKPIAAVNYNLGSSIFDPMTSSYSETSRPLLTPDEVRRSEKVIIFNRKMNPIEGEALGYHEVLPWRSWVKANPLYGSKYVGKVRLRL